MLDIYSAIYRFTLVTLLSLFIILPLSWRWVIKSNERKNTIHLSQRSPELRFCSRFPYWWANHLKKEHRRVGDVWNAVNVWASVIDQKCTKINAFHLCQQIPEHFAIHSLQIVLLAKVSVYQNCWVANKVTRNE